MHGLLIEKLANRYEDGTLVALRPRGRSPCRSVEPLIPMTRATAHGAGWSGPSRSASKTEMAR